ncbi:hypothetical protein BC834DRAFT_972247 [Gloeopeniophorella convolvens]|nr:hypothetical protein BC834DRAFT_972247 [Gloeopeniophorella convolvens]
MPLAHRGVQVSIICEGRELPLYDVTEQSDAVISACIPSKEGKRFKVLLRNSLTDHEMSCRLFMDGQRADKKHVRGNSQDESRGVRTSPSTIAPYQFKKLEVFDPDSVPDTIDSAATSSPGLIEIKCLRATAVLKRPDLVPYAVGALKTGPVSERSKKAGWHCVGLDTKSQIRVAPYHTPGSSTKLDSERNPYVTFWISYKPEELLRAQGMIPPGETSASHEPYSLGPPSRIRRRSTRAPTASGSKRMRDPSATQSTVKAEMQDGQDLEGRQRRIRELQAGISQSQAELDELMIVERPAKRVKKEAPVPWVPGEVIDLT